MGKRRTRCLIANDVPKGDISLVDTREDRRDEVRKTLGVDVYGNLDAGLAVPAWVLLLVTHGLIDLV